uniref:Uncharacterized protein n=1 Tax=Musa acuminata subsp. malaccensis TaxID=214687 RepID=A0A804ITW1_MUSAM
MACRSRHPTVRHNLLRRRGEVAPLSLQHTLSLSLSLSLCLPSIVCLELCSLSSCSSAAQTSA